MGLLKNCAAILIAGACTAAGVHATYHPVAIRMNQSVREWGPRLAAQHIEFQEDLFRPTMFDVDRSDVAAARAALAPIGKPVCSLDPESSTVAAACHIPAVGRASFATFPSGVVLMTELLPNRILSEEDQHRLLNLVLAAGNYSPANLQIVDPEGHALTEYDLRPEHSETYDESGIRVLAQPLAEELLGRGKSVVTVLRRESMQDAVKGFAPVRLRRQEPRHEIRIAVEPDVPQEARDKLVQQLTEQFRLHLDQGDSVVFTPIPFAQHHLSDEEIGRLRDKLVRPEKPISYSLLWSLATFAPALLCWALLGTELLKRHRLSR